MVKGLSTNVNEGLSEDIKELEEREYIYGTNKNPPPEMDSFLEMLWDALKDFTLRILLVCSAISIVLEETVGNSPKSIG